jgi:hypothetical protein
MHTPVVNVLSCDRVTTDGFWIGILIFCTLTQLVTKIDCSAIPNLLTLKLTTGHTLVFLPLSSNGYQRRTFLFLWVSELFPFLSYRLVTAAAHKN